jgi:hypothetical protein
VLLRYRPMTAQGQVQTRFASRNGTSMLGATLNLSLFHCESEHGIRESSVFPISTWLGYTRLHDACVRS